MRFLLFTLIFTVGSMSVQAQESHIYQKPGTEVVNETIEMLNAQKDAAESKKGYIKPHTLYLSVVDYDYFEEDQFGILIKTGDIITGCWKLSPLEYEASFTEQYYMDIKVNHYRRTAMTGNCPKGNQTVSALIVLNKSDLKAKQVKQIRISNVVARDRYSISLHDDRIELRPITSLAFKTENGPIVHYKGNKGVIALHVPMAEQGDDVANEILRVARMNNLTPLSQDISNRYSSNNETFFFMDEEGATLERLGNSEYLEVGSVKVQRPYDGPYGRTTIDKPLKVFATKAGKTL